MERNMETSRMGYIGTAIRIHSVIPDKPKAVLGQSSCSTMGKLPSQKPHMSYSLHS